MEVSLIYPHQLFKPHPAVADRRPIWLIEDPLFFGNDPKWPLRLHGQKLLLHRASISAFEEELKAAGHQVQRVENPVGQEQDSVALLNHALPPSLTAIHVVDVCDDILNRRLQRFSKERNVKLNIYNSPNFLSPNDFLTKHLAGKSKPFMARFYQSQRIRMQILMDDSGSPSGGKWSFDEENRKKLPKSHPVPNEPRGIPDSNLQEAVGWVRRRFPHHLGNLDDFRWPVTREEAEKWFEIFLSERFNDFGTYEDAISIHHPFLYHSAITPMLNIGLLDPMNIIDRTLSYSTRSGKIPINSLEGFIRQMIGWREFMRGMYLHRGIVIRSSNFWNHQRKMPSSVYDGSTGIPPVDRVIQQILKDGWCHHIERLMVLGNFFLLCRIHPDEVYRWFMEMFVDAYDWVMVPNIYGMSQYADGGSFTTKPYLSGSNYIRKMSDEPAGEWCAIWDALFWTFIAEESEFFAANPRLSMMVKTWEKIGEVKQNTHLAIASRFLKTLDGTVD